MKTPISKYVLNLLQTIGIYILLYVAFLIIDYMEPGGPCAPGLGILFAFFGVPTFTFVMVIITGINLKQKKYLLPSFIIHLLLLLSGIVFLLIAFL